MANWSKVCMTAKQNGVSARERRIGELESLFWREFGAQGKGAITPDPFVNVEWRSLRVGDRVVSLVDAEIRGRIKAIRGTKHAFLSGYSESFNLQSLRKRET